MQYSSALFILAFAATNVFAHGVVDSVKGANGVTMPGLTGKHFVHPSLTHQANPLISRRRYSS